MATVLDKIILIGTIILLFLLIDEFTTHTTIAFYTYLYTVLWILLAIKYFTRLILAKHKLLYVQNNILDLFIILFPFLRPLQIFPLTRFALIILAEQLKEKVPIFKKYKILEVLLFTIILIILASDIFIVFETGPASMFKTNGDAIWFSIVTVATVGYGDVYPKTGVGRALAILLIIFGIGLFSTITAKIASLFVEEGIGIEAHAEKARMQKLLLEEEKTEKLSQEILKKEAFLEKKLDVIKKTPNDKCDPPFISTSELLIPNFLIYFVVINVRQMSLHLFLYLLKFPFLWVFPQYGKMPHI